jgi:hypothetical protein
VLVVRVVVLLGGRLVAAFGTVAFAFVVDARIAGGGRVVALALRAALLLVVALAI